jgi:hypothetical protein
METSPAERALPPFLAKQHVLFNLRHAKYLPTPYQAEDGNRFVHSLLSLWSF